MNINKKVKLLEFKLKRTLGGGLFGAYKSKFHGSGMEFAEHKDYTFGDSIKDIDWKSSVKTNSLLVKKYEEERDLNVLFLLDISESMDFGSDKVNKKDILEDIFYSLSFSALQNNDNIGAMIYNEKKSYFIPHKKSKSNIFKILDKLYDNLDHSNLKVVKEKDNSKTENVFKELILKSINNNLIFVLTDDTNIKDEKILKLISNNNEIIIINIFDYLEKKLDIIGTNITLNNDKEFININVTNNKGKNKYSEYLNKKLDNLKVFLNKNKVGYLNIDTKSDIYKELVLYFNKIKY